MKLIKLEPLSHISFNIDSIKLFGAMYSALAEVDKSRAEEFRNAVSEGNIKISSAFPFKKEEKKDILLFPKPIKPVLRQRKENIEEFQRRKKFKKINYVDIKEFQMLLELKAYTDDVIKMFFEGREKQKNSKNNEDIVSEFEFPRNALNRITLESSIFYEHFKYIKNGGLWFIIDANRDFFESLVLPALKFLEDRGIGPNYSIGSGIFRFEHGNADDNIRNLFQLKGNGFLTLSKILPLKDETGISGFWKMHEMKGITRFGNHIYPLYLIGEGSVLSEEIHGSLEEIVENEYVINGKSFLMPCKIMRGVDENES